MYLEKKKELGKLIPPFRDNEKNVRKLPRTMGKRSSVKVINRKDYLFNP